MSASHLSRRLGVLLLGSGLLAGCYTNPREPPPPTLTAHVAPSGFPPTVRSLGLDRHFFLARAEKLRRLRAAAGGRPLRILALSGGGAGGAFGAGALLGMSRRGDRPQFDVVTGVSVGALIAPVAFLGSAWDQELADAFDSEWPEHALDRRGLEFLFRPGLYKSEPLVDVIGHFVTDRLVKAVAHEAARGRLLLVATTDLDKQEAVIWDMGAIAAQGGERARVLFRDVLVASASIPGVFPPVLIHVEGDGKSYDEMHVDGGTTMPLFIASEIAQLESRRFDAFSGAEIFVLVNTQLAAYPKSTRERPIAVLRKSFSAGLTHSLRSSLELTAAFAQRNGMDFHLSYIPMSYPYQGSLSLKFPAMHALFDYGARCAETGRLWTTLEQAIQEEQQAASTLPRTTEDCPAPGTARQPAVPESTAAASLAR